jgi:hypothetical protein
MPRRRAAWVAAVVRPPVVQRDAAPGHAAAARRPAQQNATNAAQARNARARRPRSRSALGRHARRPRRRPGPRMAGAFARLRRRLRQHPADRPAGAGGSWWCGAWSRRVRAGQRCPGQGGFAYQGAGASRQRQRRRAVQPEQGRQRRVGPAVGAQRHRLRRHAADDAPHGSSLRSGAGRWQHDRLGAGGSQSWGVRPASTSTASWARPSATS